MRTASILVAAALLWATPAAADPAFKVIVNAANPVTTLPRAHLSQLFLKRDKRWPGGGAVQPVEPADAALRERFSTRVHGKGAAAIRAYWNQLIFSGREVPPVEKRTDDEIVAYVRASPGGIGYVSPGASTSGVKVVTVEE